MGSGGSCSLNFPKCVLKKRQNQRVSPVLLSWNKRRKVFYSSPSNVMVNVYPPCVCVCVVCVLGMEWVCTNGRRKLDIR